MLTGSFYMLQVYDRVLPSRSVPTLVVLTAVVLMLFAFQATVDLIRNRVLVRIGTYFDGALTEKAFRADLNPNRRPGTLPSRDLDQVRSFLLGGGPSALFDLPWLPLYAGLCFLFHPWIGYAVLIGAVLLTIPTVITEILTRRATKETTEIANRRHLLSEASRRNAEVLLAAGMLSPMAERWRKLNQDFMRQQQSTSDVTGGFGAVTKSMRMCFQSLVLGLGAYLVIHGEATAGVIIASSILSARALAPVEQVIAHWKGFVAARQSYARLTATLAGAAEPEYTNLPVPKRTFIVEAVSVIPPGSNRLVVADVSFTLQAGQGLGIIGPSASGKSTLVRALVGVSQPARGKVRIDGAALDQWSPEARGSHVGYLPQDVELFAGTIAENITRFEQKPSEEAMIAAAEAAGVNDMILRLPDGYQTQIGENGAILSNGQRQRIALARALYKDPFVVILDEPNSNLDHEGEVALTTALQGVRARGGIVVLVAHRPSALAAVDLVMIMQNGGVQVIGPRDQILGKIAQLPTAPQQPRRIAGDVQ
jgi:ATP-binding cassette subfamily C protein